MDLAVQNPRNYVTICRPFIECQFQKLHKAGYILEISVQAVQTEIDLELQYIVTSFVRNTNFTPYCSEAILKLTFNIYKCAANCYASVNLGQVLSSAIKW